MKLPEIVTFSTVGAVFTKTASIGPCNSLSIAVPKSVPSFGVTSKLMKLPISEVFSV
jgi:hypothetical protein